MASMDQYVAVAAFANQLRAERLPDDPPLSLEEQIGRWHHLPAFMERAAWVVWNAHRSMIIARGELYLVHTPENQHLAHSSRWRCCRGCDSKALGGTSSATLPPGHAARSGTSF
jgi:hypothetical protein